VTFFNVTDGRPEPLGVQADVVGLNVAVHSGTAEAIVFCLFDADDREIEKIPLPARTGDVFHGHIAGIGAGARYGLRAYGPWDPAHGLRFNPAKLLLDPFATAIDRPFRLHASLFEGDADSAAVMPKAIVGAAFDAASGTQPFAWDRQVIYELHVRGFTMQCREIPTALRGTFAGLAHPAAIGHLTRLGITTVEIMPAAAWLDERHLPSLGLTNYWGYNPVAFLAPDPRLAPGGWKEIRAAVAALQAAGIAVLLDVVLNHTGEGDHLGPTVSLRGLDNAGCYRLLPGSFDYVNDTGCGNTLALEKPFMLRLAMAALRCWALRGGVDGFRLDLATTLGRRADGFDAEAPLFAAIEQDPVLRDRAFIAEPWDIGWGGYQLGTFPARWGEWNDRCRDTIRRFWRGDGGMLGELATRFAGSAEVFALRHRPLTRSINFVTAHDGFSLADLVSFTEKHNEANGEANRDGTDANYSWNSGAEAPREARALLATLLLSHGTPMLSMGDECGRSQGGNNNAYAQDNEISWLDWAAADPAMIYFSGRLVRARLGCPALTGGRMLTGLPVDASGIADVAWLRPDGCALAADDWQDQVNQTLIAALYAPGSRVVVVMHAGRSAIEVVLPEPRPGQRWRRVIDSAEVSAGLLTVAARSVVLFVEEAGAGQRRWVGVTSEALDRLARAAGILSNWWDVGGREHRVGDDTKRALLAAMRLPAATASEFSASEARLGAVAPLPPALVVRAGTAIVVPVASGAHRWVTLLREDGGIERFPIPPGDPRRMALPPLPLGRHTLLLEDSSDAVCHLAVVPTFCHLPDDRRRFGIAAHLYSLRRAGDQGIGDFSTLTKIAEAAAAQGAAVIGLNPLHALFPLDRSRASPYQPSHREFLDPIYIDVPGVPGVADADLVDFPRVWAAKARVLQAEFDAGAADDPAFDAFVTAGGEALRRFAEFEAIAEIEKSTNWPRWPEHLRHPRASGVAAVHGERTRFACYLQYRADTQFAAAAARANQAGLVPGFYRDLAVGSAPDGAEAWAHQDARLAGVSIGAPPDPFAEQGQVWSLPPPDPFAMRREGFAGFAALLAANMRHAGALRIDHVMGLQRLFLVPDGASARDGAYLGYPLQDQLGHLALESNRQKCMVVGEDLGTVPEGLSATLAAANVLSYRVLWFERDGEEFRPPERWPALAAACVSTHDLPTLAGWWQGADIAERKALGLVDAAAAEAARAADKAALVAALRQEHLLTKAVDLAGPLTPALCAAVHALIAATPALLALVQADDLSGETLAVNLPGTDHERANWRRRLRADVASLFGSDAARLVLAAMRAAGRGNESL
jgi:glycogen operon protein